jgi:hypothetical protein
MGMPRLYVNRIRNTKRKNDEKEIRLKVKRGG